MTEYLIEFALIHMVVFGLYQVLLRQETQVGFLRFYLLAATFLALMIPAVELPNLTPVENINITGQVTAMVLPEVSTATPVNNGPTYGKLLLPAYLLITALMALRFLLSLGRIVVLYRQSQPWQVAKRHVRHYQGLSTSFTFFRWIFIDKDKFADPQDIVRHEEAHIVYGHSYDLLLLNLLLIPFWWVPSLWLALRELKQLHEFQADAYALNGSPGQQYIHTLITHTLKQQGFILTNSFNDTPLTKRLKYMKQLKKNIKPWKAATALTVLLLTAYTFSCQQLAQDELPDTPEPVMIDPNETVFQIVDEPPTFLGGPEAFYAYVKSAITYPQKALEEKISGKVFVELIISKEGKVSNVKVLRGAGYGLDEVAKHVVQNSPNWIPGKQKGRPVNVKLVVPITFRHPDDPVSQVPDKVREQVVDPPAYAAGMEAFYQYAHETMVYPQEALEAGLSGRVFVQFTVKVDGTIGDDIHVLKGLSPECDREAVRLIRNSGKWQPGKRDGKVAEITMVIPVDFVHPNDPKAKEMAQKVRNADAPQK